MSAESGLFFYGVRYLAGPDDMALLEARKHPLMQKARSAKMDFYWGKFTGATEKYYLYIGTIMGIIGPENESEIIYNEVRLNEIVSKTKRDLLNVDISDTPQFFAQWVYDNS